VESDTATMPVTVTAMFAALSRARRGRRAASLSPNSAGTGSLPEIRMSQARRLSGRATSFSAAIVLLRAERMAGTSVAASAATIARPTTSAVALSEIGGAPAVRENCGCIPAIQMTLAR
jgi:hypothetical protein